MFSWLNKQGVKSNKGFIVQSMSRFTIEYREDSRSILVTVDNGQLPDGRFCEIIGHDAFSKWDDGTTIPQDKQKEILKNFTAAMEFQGLGVIVK